MEYSSSSTSLIQAKIHTILIKVVNFVNHIMEKPESTKPNPTYWTGDDEYKLIGYECMDCGNSQNHVSSFGCDKCRGLYLEPWYDWNYD